MPKVYPNETATEQTKTPQHISDRKVEALTVWKKSLLFNSDGFTVFDTKGNLVFRVDNYQSGSKKEIVLMSGTGKPLLTIRRKRTSFADNWMVFDGETAVSPLFLVKKPVNFLASKDLAHVISCQSINGLNKNLMYEITGSYAHRCVAVYDNKKRLVAEIQRKEAKAGVTFGGDVFKLTVQPELDQTVAMALVILMEQMFGLGRSISLR
ncbi:hypothetical protein C5167_002205 [Papaver somniferum]|uniref:Protein LURP-one-related 8 n=1 Tax=Papaver somniferum TaxID=3469 RepID=A0A4Y7KZ15_PAPSO|nr:protein LURP-one-related 8-like [Papaver somniferum]RZC78007.1 hypothetical protein C5167_002205 [Papaver somniferum]